MSLTHTNSTHVSRSGGGREVVTNGVPVAVEVTTH